jgi:hypothetical protein
MNSEVEKEWMRRLSDRGELIQLIQDTLGCGCPQQVFEHARLQMVWAAHTPMVQLILGNKLLVWIADLTRIDRAKNGVSALLKEGRIERDRRNLNRFRLVLVGELARSEANGLLALHEARHEKVHLHLLPRLS